MKDIYIMKLWEQQPLISWKLFLWRLFSGLLHILGCSNYGATFWGFDKCINALTRRNMFKDFSNSWMRQQDVEFNAFVTDIDSEYRRTVVWTWCTDKHPLYQSSEMTPKGVNSERIIVCEKVLRAPEGSKMIVNSEVALVTLWELTPPTQTDLLPERRGGARLLGLHMGGGVKAGRANESQLMMITSLNYKWILILNIRH